MKNALKINDILENQARFERMLSDQKKQIAEIKTLLESYHKTEVESVEIKSRPKGRKSEEFYHVNIYHVK